MPYDSKIYKICSDIGPEVYIGSTRQKYLSSRYSTHKQEYKRNKNITCNKCACFDIFDKYGVENCKIILIERFECETSEDMRKKEQFYIDNTACVNKIRAYTSQEDRDKYLKEYYKLKSKKHQQFY